MLPAIIARVVAGARAAKATAAKSIAGARGVISKGASAVRGRVGGSGAASTVADQFSAFRSQPTPLRQRALAAYDGLTRRAWETQSAIELAKSSFGLPMMMKSVAVMVEGGPRSNLQSIHRYAMSLAFGRLADANELAILPFRISVTWSPTDLKIQAIVEYNVNSIAVLGARSTEGVANLINGVQPDCVGGNFPEFLTDFAASLRVPNISFQGNPPLGTNYKLPQDGNLLIVPTADPRSATVVNPGPVVGDGVRSTLLELVEAALSDSKLPLADFPQRPENEYNPLSKPQDKGNKPDGADPRIPPYPSQPNE